MGSYSLPSPIGTQKEPTRNLEQSPPDPETSSTVATQDEIKLSNNHNQNFIFIFNFQINQLGFNGLHSTYKVVSKALNEKERTL